MTTVTTFLVWSWVGWRGKIYTAARVNAFCRMLTANLSMPHRIICITDNPRHIEVETYPLWEDWPNMGRTGKPNCFRRLRLFDPEFARQFGERLVSIDIDAVIRGDITHLFDTDADFKILKGRAAQYNGSLWLLKPGVHPHVWTQFDPVESPRAILAHRVAAHAVGDKFVGSDQAWMSLQIQGAETWEAGTDVVNYRSCERDGLPEHAKLVFFQGRMKPWDYAVHCKVPELYETWERYAA